MGLGYLIGGLSANPNVVVVMAESIPNLNDYTLVQNDWITNDMEAEDELSSMLVIGNSGARIECYNARDFKGSFGWFDLTVTGLAAAVRNLPTLSPTAELEGVCTVQQNPTEWFVNSFGDTLSSVRWG